MPDVPEPDLEFTVFGVPAQKGSHRAFVVKGRAVVTNDNNARLRDWSRQINDVVQGLAGRGAALDEPLRVDVVFHMYRPKSGVPKIQRWHSRRPDIDKLVRALLDPLVNAGVMKDDALVSELRARKEYVSGAFGDVAPRAHVRIWTMAHRYPSEVPEKRVFTKKPGPKPKVPLLDASSTVARGGQ